MSVITELTNVFNNIVSSVSPSTAPTDTSNLTNLKTIAVGNGNKSWYMDERGLWLGATDPGNAPFYVDMSGNVKAASLIASGYLSVGGAATDVNNGSTTINGARLTAGTVVADTVRSSWVYAGNISANQINTGTLNANNISVINLNADNITAGTITATRIASLDASKIGSGTFDSSRIPNLSAGKITADILYVGGTGEVSAIYMRRDDTHSSTGTFLRWEGGSRIWADTSNRIGINSIGSPMYIYVDSSERIVIPSSGQTTIRDGVYCDGNLNVANTTRFQGDVLINNNWISFNNSGTGHTMRCDVETSFYNDSSNGPQIKFDNWNRDLIIGGGSSIRVNGNWKTAIVPTKNDGYRALYCMESPEIWFMDFVGENKMLSTIFDEVTEGECKYIKVEGGGYQVWRRRKNTSGIRFEKKTKAQFLQNEKFLHIPHSLD